RVRPLVRARPAGGGHLAAGQLPRHLFPDVRVGGHVFGADGVEGQPGFLVLAVVAREAVPRDELFDGGALGSRLPPPGRGGRLLGPVQADQSAGQEENGDPTAGRTPRSGHEELLRRMCTRQLARIASERQLKGATRNWYAVQPTPRRICRQRKSVRKAKP